MFSELTITNIFVFSEITKDKKRRVNVNVWYLKLSMSSIQESLMRRRSGEVAYYIVLRDISEKGVLSRLGVECHLFKAIICQIILLFLRSLVGSLLPLLCLLFGYENPGYELRVTGCPGLLHSASI